MFNIFTVLSLHTDEPNAIANVSKTNISGRPLKNEREFKPKH